MGYLVVLVTAPTAEEAGRIGQTIVQERLAACANVMPAVTSTYWWQGQVQRADEALLVLKTREDLIGALRTRVQALHSYSVPEVIALPVVGGNPDYLAWIDDSVRRPEPGR